MRLVFIIESFPEINNIALIQKIAGLFKRGLDLHLICKRPLAKDAWQMFGELHSQPKLRRRVHDGLETAVAINDQLFALDPDLIIFENAKEARHSMYLKEFANSKVAVQFQGEDLSYFEADQTNIFTEIWERAAAVLFESERLRQLAQKRGCPAEKTSFIIPLHLNISPDAMAETATEDRLETAERPLRILTLAPLIWQNGHVYALPAVRHLLDVGVACHYHILGNGPCAAELQVVSRRLQLQDNVSFLAGGQLSARKEALSWADLLLHTAVAPGSCQPVVEARAMQLPVVCTDAGSLPELVRDGETGFVVPRRRPDLIAEKLILFAKDATRRQHLKQASRKWRQQQPTTADCLASLEQIYREIIRI